jgi:AcrR family transcriptional regulator
MSSAADETRRRLIEAATQGFAEHGIHSASLLDITRQAGQRNRGAVHYHFGSRTGMLVAVLDQYVPYLKSREDELLAAARQPGGDLDCVVEAFVRPALEIAEQGSLGRWYLMVLVQLVDEDDESMDPDVRSALVRAGGYEAFELLETRMPPMPEALRAERMFVVTAFILRAIADRSRARERPEARAQLDSEPFAANLVSMVVGMLTAPVAG